MLQLPCLERFTRYGPHFVNLAQVTFLGKASSGQQWNSSNGVYCLSPEIKALGYPATAELSSLINSNRDLINLLGSGLGATIKEGDFLKNMEYADTLRKLAQSRDPIHMFYKGDIANQIVNEMKNKGWLPITAGLLVVGGLITKLDLVSYECTVEEPLFVHFNENFTLVGPQPPSGFAAYQLGVRLTLGARIQKV